MVSLFGRGFDSLQLHFVTPSRGLTLVRVLSFASLDESGKAERDSLQLHFVTPSRGLTLVRVSYFLTTAFCLEVFESFVIGRIVFHDGRDGHSGSLAQSLLK